MTPTADDLLPCPFCGQPKDWIDNQYEGLSPACTNQDCFAYAIPMYFCKEGALPTRAAPRWIPVTERLPEVDGWYIVARKLDTNAGLPPLEITMRKFYIKSGWQSVSEAFPVTHWMPLPLPPKEVEGC